ncbi:MAG: ATP-binding protein [Candidatus Brocadiia bacterium]
MNYANPAGQTSAGVMARWSPTFGSISTEGGELPGNNVVRALKPAGSTPSSFSVAGCEVAERFICWLQGCPCDCLTDPRKECHCTPRQIQQYMSKTSEPLLDHMSLQVEAQRAEEGKAAAIAALMRPPKWAPDVPPAAKGKVGKTLAYRAESSGNGNFSAEPPSASVGLDRRICSGGVRRADRNGERFIGGSVTVYRFNPTTNGGCHP